MGRRENVESRAVKSVRRGSIGMEWRIEEQEELPNNAGYLVTVAEHDDGGHLTGLAITVPCSSKVNGDPRLTEEAIKGILRQVRIRVGKYLGYEPAPVSDN
jgi:hypothetical protein